MSIQTKEDALTRIVKSMSHLSDVEELIKRYTKSEAPILEEISLYLLTLGGKRIRPLLTLLTAQACGHTYSEPEEPLIQIAAGIELIHMATLLHDDIIDRSPKRRSKEAPWLKFGVNNTLICGDFLLSRAFSLCAKLSPFIIEETHKACVELTEGEVTEVPLYQQRFTLNESLEIARKKTASLFRLSALSGAFCAGASSEAIKRYAEFGEALGISFQILDDILDVTGDEALLGKKPGVDIKEKKPSYINLVIAQSTDPHLHATQKALLSPDELSEEQIAEYLLAIKNAPEVVIEAQTAARKHAEIARKALHAAGEITTKKSLQFSILENIVDYTLERLR
jgi:octaprenyl-diphosphate synthase